MTRPARVTQSQVERAIKAARRQGATAVDVRPDGTIRINLVPVSGENPQDLVEPAREIVL